MKRLLSAMKIDVTIQYRNKLYAIGIFVGIILAVALSWLANPRNMYAAVPTAMLLVVGGTTLFYVGGMILFEKEEGTLSAVSVSPLSSAEYLGSKIITLTILATVESIVMIAGATLIMSLTFEISSPDTVVLLTGIVGISIMYILVGIILIVRYDKITDFLIPMAAVAVILQLPFVYFLDVVVHPFFLVIPSSAPTLLMKGAYVDLALWEWWYASGYTFVTIAVLAIWAYRAFQKHILIETG